MGIQRFTDREIRGLEHDQKHIFLLPCPVQPKFGDESDLPPIIVGEHGFDRLSDALKEVLKYSPYRPGDEVQVASLSSGPLFKLLISGVSVIQLSQITFYDWVADFCPSSREQSDALKSFIGSEYQRKTFVEMWDEKFPEHPFSPDLFVFKYSFTRVRIR